MIYAFKCNTCKTEFDKNLRLGQFEEFKEKKLEIECTECKSKDVKNVLVAMSFKKFTW